MKNKYREFPLKETLYIFMRNIFIFINTQLFQNKVEKRIYINKKRQEAVGHMFSVLNITF